VANWSSGTVSVVDTDLRQVLATIDTGAGSRPTYVGLNRTTNRVYVPLHGHGQLAVIDGGNSSLVTKVDVGIGAFGVAVDAELDRVFVSTRDAGYVAVVDGSSLAELSEQRTYLGGTPFALAIDPALRRLYAIYAEPAAQTTGLGSASSLEGLEAEDPQSVAVLKITAEGLNRISTFTADPSSPFGGLGIAVNSATGNIFATNAQDDSLSVFHPIDQVLVDIVPMPGEPGCVSVNPVTDLVYVSNLSSNVVVALRDTW
jgi:YVTN family beta-propeller protein